MTERSPEKTLLLLRYVPAFGVAALFFYSVFWFHLTWWSLASAAFWLVWLGVFWWVTGRFVRPGLTWWVWGMLSLALGVLVLQASADSMSRIMGGIFWLGIVIGGLVWCVTLERTAVR